MRNKIMPDSEKTNIKIGGMTCAPYFFFLASLRLPGSKKKKKGNKKNSPGLLARQLMETN